MRLSKVALISKEGHGEAKDVAKDVAMILIDAGLSVTSFPNLHLKEIDHVTSINEMSSSKFDLILTVSGDGTILRALRILDSDVPCLCVNVGGRGILAEIKSDQAKSAIEKVRKGDFRIDKRIRINASLDGRTLPPALNEIYALRQSITRTPIFTIDLGSGAAFTQRMDGLLVSTPTGSSGHSYSFFSPFVQGILNLVLLTPVGSIKGFPKIVKDSAPFRLMSNYALNLIIDGQETTNAEANTYINFKKHERDATFIRFGIDGSFRQLRNLGFD